MKHNRSLSTKNNRSLSTKKQYKPQKSNNNIIIGIGALFAAVLACGIYAHLKRENKIGNLNKNSKDLKEFDLPTDSQNDNKYKQNNNSSILEPQPEFQTNIPKTEIYNNKTDIENNGIEVPIMSKENIINGIKEIIGDNALFTLINNETEKYIYNNGIEQKNNKVKILYNNKNIFENNSSVLSLSSCLNTDELEGVGQAILAIINQNKDFIEFLDFEDAEQDHTSDLDTDDSPDVAKQQGDDTQKFNTNGNPNANTEDLFKEVAKQPKDNTQEFNTDGNPNANTEDLFKGENVYDIPTPTTEDLSDNSMQKTQNINLDRNNNSENKDQYAKYINKNKHANENLLNQKEEDPLIKEIRDILKPSVSYVLKNKGNNLYSVRYQAVYDSKHGNKLQNILPLQRDIEIMEINIKDKEYKNFFYELYENGIITTDHFNVDSNIQYIGEKDVIRMINIAELLNKNQLKDITEKLINKKKLNKIYT